MFKKIVVGCVLSGAALGSWAGAIWDLAADWSDTINPNGAWALNQGSTPLTNIPDFTAADTSGIPAQPAWAPSNSLGNFLPMWMKARATVADSWQVGDVLVHSTGRYNSAGSGFANVTWTSPFSGTANVSGALWEIRDIGRANVWTLLHNGTTLATGTLVDGGGHGRINPQTFAFSSLAVSAGDVLTLKLDSASADGAGELAGVNFKIAQISVVPEPGTYLLMLAGVALLASVLRRQGSARPASESRLH
ncbi:PEP-CTERM sorting domain-containing protein [Roseateles sp. PN1]|uniref:PEP-CTERM sorting domain-containing protein n=1 Tax=Roseateles sp. PN1 TaxID=3137372 RepID=UPI003138BD86